MTNKSSTVLILLFCFLKVISSAEDLIAKKNNSNTNFLSLNGIQIKAYYDNENIHFVIIFNEATEKRSHKSWLWDPLLQHYIQDNDRETIFSIIIQSPVANFADLWVWRSFLTDPVGTAEDMYLLGYDKDNQANSLLRIEADEGQSCWTTKYYDDFCGERIPRFSHRIPVGSIADVSSRSKWQDGSWEIKLRRKLNTEHRDDIQLELGKKYRIILFKGIPGQVEPSGTLNLILEKEKSDNEQLQ